MVGIQRALMLWLALAVGAPTAWAQGAITLIGLDGKDTNLAVDVWRTLPRIEIRAVGHDGREAGYRGSPPMSCFADWVRRSGPNCEAITSRSMSSSMRWKAIVPSTLSRRLTAMRSSRVVSATLAASP